MPAASNYREHRENRMVGILRRTAVFDELVKRFVAGQSVIGVADWVYESKPKGLVGVSYGTLRVYLTALRARIRHCVVEQIQQNHESSQPPESVQPERIAQAIQMAPMPPHRLDRLEAMVDKRLRDVAAMDMLRFAFVVQYERVMEMRKLEGRTEGMLIPNGFKEIKLLKNIAEAMAKIEYGDQVLRWNGAGFLRPPHVSKIA